jgi:uncharacterized membrane protein
MKIKLDTADKVLEAVALVALLTTAAIIAINIPNLPNIIPNHFDFNGVPNQYGSKNTLWAVVAVSVFIYMLIGIISMFPESFNYPSQKNDKESQYKLGTKLVRSLKASILIFILIVSVVIIQSAKTGTAKGAGWLIALILIIVFGNLIWFAVKWRKIK